MDKLMKPERSSYCPITVSELAVNNAKVRQNSLREYSHAQNAAYRAFCRGPGRPQTAAFGRLYFETPPNRRSLSPSRANLGDCVRASKATVEASGATAKESRRTCRPIYTEQRLLQLRSNSARRALRHSPSKVIKQPKLNDEEAVKISRFGKYLDDSVFVDECKEETSDFLIEQDSSFEKKRGYECDNESNGKARKTTPVVSDIVDRHQQLNVYHFVDNGCSCSADLCYRGDPLVSCKACGCNQQFLVSSYSVEIQGNGHLSTPGLGSWDSQENRALWDLLQKQLTVSRQQYNSDDNFQHHLESLNLLISRLINVKPPNGYVYYFAYGPEINTERFTTHIQRKPEDTAWGLLYGFKLTSPDMQGCWQRSFWPKWQYSPQCAVEGRIYTISRQEADLLDRQMTSKQGLVTVLLPVWLMNSDDNAHSTAQYCLPALVHVLPPQ